MTSAVNMQATTGRFVTAPIPVREDKSDRTLNSSSEVGSMEIEETPSESDKKSLPAKNDIFSDEMNRKALNVVTFAILGVFSRYYTTRLVTKYDFVGYGIITDSFIANVLGTLILGFLGGIEINGSFIHYGLSTGYCGSFTTFGSFMYETSDLLIHQKRGGVFYILALLTGIWCFTSVFHTGRTVGINCRKLFRNHFVSNINIEITLFLVVLIGALIAGVHSESTVLYFTLFGPMGALGRFYLGFLFNKPDFPLGTFTANVAGSTISGIIGNCQSTHPVVKGLEIGFTGCLSTVSTFMKEIVTMYSKDETLAHKYVVCTVVCAQLLCCLTFLIRT